MVRVDRNLKSCPACGAEEVSVSDMLRLAYTEHMSDEKKEELSKLYCVRCENAAGAGCYSMSPPFSTKQEAIDYWQKPMKFSTEIQIGGDVNAIKAMSKMR